MSSGVTLACFLPLSCTASLACGYCGCGCGCWALVQRGRGGSRAAGSCTNRSGGSCTARRARRGGGLLHPALDQEPPELPARSTTQAGNRRGPAPCRNDAVIAIIAQTCRRTRQAAVEERPLPLSKNAPPLGKGTRPRRTQSTTDHEQRGITRTVRTSAPKRPLCCPVGCTSVDSVLIDSAAPPWP